MNISLPKKACQLCSRIEIITVNIIDYLLHARQCYKQSNSFNPLFFAYRLAFQNEQPEFFFLKDTFTFQSFS